MIIINIIVQRIMIFFLVFFTWHRKGSRYVEKMLYISVCIKRKDSKFVAVKTVEANLPQPNHNFMNFKVGNIFLICAILCL